MACVLKSKNRIYITLLDKRVLTRGDRSDGHIILVSQVTAHLLVREEACKCSFGTI